MLVNKALIKTLLRVIENDFQKIIAFLAKEVKQERNSRLKNVWLQANYSTALKVQRAYF